MHLFFASTNVEMKILEKLPIGKKELPFGKYQIHNLMYFLFCRPLLIEKKVIYENYIKLSAY
jgi:hypothetical protein